MLHHGRGGGLPKREAVKTIISKRQDGGHTPEMECAQPKETRAESVRMDKQKNGIYSIHEQAIASQAQSGRVLGRLITHTHKRCRVHACLFVLSSSFPARPPQVSTPPDLSRRVLAAKTCVLPARVRARPFIELPSRYISRYHAT
jgi:hypothetical protein